MKFRLGATILVILMFLSCAVSPKKIVGKYCSMSKKEFRIKFPFKKAATAIGVELDVFSDSTFEYKTCSKVFRGLWKISSKQEALILNVNRAC